MAVGDKKVKRIRSKGWSARDSRRWERQAERERIAEQKEREAMLGAMTPAQRSEFLANERAEKERQARLARQRQIEWAKNLHEKRQQIVAESRLIGGFVESELAQAIKRRPSYGQYEGEWLEDPVSALTGQGGFAEDMEVTAGIKLQIHICLDISNSMYHNGLGNVAVEAARNLYLALETASKTLPGNSLQVHLWTWAGDKDGKEVSWLSNPRSARYYDDNPLGFTSDLPGYTGSWTGEDTWLYPLLERLDKWEQNNGDHGAYRLDLIISDGVLDHPTDARKGDEIQDRRDGRLQSVVLNFLPFEEWADYRVPNRCIQYPVDPDNLMPMMRQVLGEWLVGI